MQQLGISAIHPTAPEVLSAVALFSAPINLDEVLVRLKDEWALPIESKWHTVPAKKDQPELISGELLTFSQQGVQVALSPLNYPLNLEVGALPEHVFHVPITLYAPLETAELGVLAGENLLKKDEILEIRRRKRMLSAHILLTQITDALMAEPAAIGVFRSELGVVQPPQMIREMSEFLTEGETPLPLWVNVRTQQGETSYGRTLGMPLFGHLDVEIRESTQSANDIYIKLAQIAKYIISGDAYLLPEQTLGGTDKEKIEIVQEVSPFDGSSVMRVLYE